jgi:hypothetical protein
MNQAARFNVAGLNILIYSKQIRRMYLALISEKLL